MEDTVNRAGIREYEERKIWEYGNTRNGGHSKWSQNTGIEERRIR